MQVNVEDLSGVKKVLHIEIPQQTVTEMLDDAYGQIGKTSKIKGFRPGKAPRSVLVRLYKKNVHADVTSRIIQDTLPNAIAESGLKMVGDPSIDPPELDPESSFKYDVTMEVFPELPTIDFNGIDLTKTMYKVNDEEIDAQLKVLQKTVTDKRPITDNRPAKQGDYVVIDYEGLKNGKPFTETQRTENYTLKIGTGLIHPEMDKQIEGMVSGEEKEIVVTFPDSHANKALKNETIDFQVVLKEIREEIEYEINDDFAKKLGNYQTLDQLKEDIVANLNQGYQKRIEQEINEQIFSTLIEKMSFEVPEAMVNIELEHILSDIERSVEYYQKTLADLGMNREGLSEKYRGIAIKQVKRQILLAKIIQQEKLTLSDEELEEGFRNMASSMNQPLEPIKQFYETNPDKVDLFKHALLEKKAIRLIIENGNITEKEPVLESKEQVVSES